MKKKPKIKEINPEQILLKNRQIFIFSEVNNQMARDICQKLLALDSMNHKPIKVWINSGGGCVEDGFAIIDIMKAIKSEVHTIVNGEACSMAGMISIVGDKRFMTEHSMWMCHDMAGGVWGDYTTKVLDRAKMLERVQKTCVDHLKKHTTLNKDEIQQGTHGELWYYPEECLEKGIIDKILE